MANPRYANGHRRRQLRARVLAAYDTCALCDHPVDKTLHHLHDLAPEVDEDMPVSKGGSPYEWANLNLMHRVCNRWKGNLTLVEARAKLAETPAPQPEPIVTSQAW